MQNLLLVTICNHMRGKLGKRGHCQQAKDTSHAAHITPLYLNGFHAGAWIR